MDTKEILIGMLKENTGEHFLDSGGAYGRHWQQNQDRDFEKEEEVVLDVWNSWFAYSVNVFHFLSRKLSYREDVQELFEEFLKEREDTYWLEDMEEFPLWLMWKGHKVGCRILTCKTKFPINQSSPWLEIRSGYTLDVTTDNTYNGESNLSQVLQYATFELDDSLIVLLQVHNGCDVRGGYTAPKAFESSDGDIFWDSSASATLYCQSCHAEWRTDDGGYSWYPEHNTNIMLEDRLTSVTIVPDDYKCPPPSKHRVTNPTSLPIYPPDNKVFCPHCGQPLVVGVL
jgi:hypothetical protein